MLAEVPGLTVKGSVVDRAGRSGVAVTTTSSNTGVRTAYTMIFDPNTGMLLDYEQVALEDGTLEIKAPATTSYTVWLRKSRVATVDDRP